MTTNDTVSPPAASAAPPPPSPIDHHPNSTFDNERPTMNTDAPTIRSERRPASFTSRLTSRKVVATGLLAVAASAAVIGVTGSASGQAGPRTRHLVERLAITEQLVERGAIPWQSLLTAPGSHDPLIQDLVDSGSIPRQALLPSSPADDPFLVDLVARGVIPREALLPAAPEQGT